MNAAATQTSAAGLHPDLDALVAALPAGPDGWKARRAAVLEALAGFKADRDPLAASLDRCLAVLRARAVAVGSEPVPAATAPHAQPTLPAPERATADLPATGTAGDESARAAAKRAAPAAGPVWSPSERALYDDLLVLFELGDSVGAMTSLERLFMLNPDAAELKAFLSKNQELLIRLYRESLGALDRVPVPRKDRAPVRVPAGRPSLLMDVLRLCDGHRALREIVRKTGMGELHTLLTVSHLVRSGFVELA